MSQSSKVLVVHDYFAIRGGGERLALTLANGLSADLMYGFRTDESYELDQFPRQSIDLLLPRTLRRPMYRVGALSLRFALTRSAAEKYCTRIFSGASSLFAAPEQKAGECNIYYCHTPPRFLFDQRDFFNTARTKSWGTRFSAPALREYRRNYFRSLDRMDIVIANSRNVQDRIKRYLGRDSIIVHPPVDVEGFVWRSQADYYLSCARLSKLKRVDKIVEAFRTMPHLRLVVASGGEELPYLRELAKDSPNISFTGWIDDRQMKALVGGAIATIYVPIEEDFGMSPVESMAAGKPVIGVCEGGLTESIVQGRTGFLLPRDFSVDDLREAVQAMSAAQALTMRGDCEERASVFSEGRFLKQMTEFL